MTPVRDSRHPKHDCEDRFHTVVSPRCAVLADYIISSRFASARIHLEPRIHCYVDSTCQTCEQGDSIERMVDAVVLSLRIRPMNELTAPERECYAAVSNLGRKDKHVRYI